MSYQQLFHKGNGNVRSVGNHKGVALNRNILHTENITFTKAGERYFTSYQTRKCKRKK